MYRRDRSLSWLDKCDRTSTNEDGSKFFGFDDEVGVSPVGAFIGVIKNFPIHQPAVAGQTHRTGTDAGR